MSYNTNNFYLSVPPPNLNRQSQAELAKELFSSNKIANTTKF